MSDVSPQCPVCGTPISKTRFSEIQAQIRSEEKAKLEVQAKRLQAEHEATLTKATSEAARKAKQEVEQKLDRALLKETQLAEQVGQLKENEKKLLANASRTQDQLKLQHERELKSTTEKAAADARAAVLSELNAKDAEMRALKHAHGQELQHQRLILDEHRDQELQKLRSEHARADEALQRKVQELNRKLEQKNAHDLGEIPEIDLYQSLSEAFPGDRVRRVKKGESGADIVHDVMHNGQHCQTIVYDSKNRRLWQPQFVQKLLADKANAKAEHGVLVSAVFPSGHRDLCVVDGVVVAKLSQAVTVAKLLRDAIVTDYLRNLSFKDRTEKRERLYSLITSEAFRQRMATIENAVRQLEKIDAKEVDDHRRVWTARSVYYRTADKSVRDLLTEVNVILESRDPRSPAATGTHDTLPF